MDTCTVGASVVAPSRGLLDAGSTLQVAARAAALSGSFGVRTGQPENAKDQLRWHIHTLPRAAESVLYRPVIARQWHGDRPLSGQQDLFRDGQLVVLLMRMRHLNGPPSAVPSGLDRCGGGRFIGVIAHSEVLLVNCARSARPFGLFACFGPIL